jgi:TonB family protein
MKILLPISNRFDLVVSALAAAMLHAGILGLGISYARSPTPLIQQTHRCESVSFLPAQKVKRELVNPMNRERVEDPLDRALLPERLQVHESIARASHRYVLPSKKEFSLNHRTHQEERAREKTPTHKKEKHLKPEERELKTPGQRDLAISRSAAPAVKKGFTFTYPRFAQERGYEGRVQLRITVSPEGRALEVEILKSSGYAILDRSARTQVEKIRYLPALDRSGDPIESKVVQTVGFYLKDAHGGFDAF